MPKPSTKSFIAVVDEESMTTQQEDIDVPQYEGGEESN